MSTNEISILCQACRECANFVADAAPFSSESCRADECDEELSSWAPIVAENAAVDLTVALSLIRDLIDATQAVVDAWGQWLEADIENATMGELESALGELSAALGKAES